MQPRTRSIDRSNPQLHPSGCWSEGALTDSVFEAQDGCRSTEVDIPAIWLIATGGTIAAVDGGSRHLGASDLLVGLRRRGRLIGTAVVSPSDLLLATGSSVDVTPHETLRLTRQIRRRRRHYDGMVIAHGSDTLAEAAYLAELVLRPGRPVVFTAAFRRADERGTDAWTNLADAITVAAAAECHGRGVLVVAGGEVHRASEVWKVRDHAGYRFSSGEAGPIGLIHGRRLDMTPRAPARVRRFAINALQARVPLIPLYAGVEPSDVDRILATAPDGAVLVGFGEGSVPSAITPVLDRAMRRGTVLVVASTCNLGATSQSRYHSRTASWVPNGVVLTNENPWKARIRLQVLLSARRNQRVGTSTATAHRRAICVSDA
jgi:L-asparaginase